MTIQYGDAERIRPAARRDKPARGGLVGELTARADEARARYYGEEDRDTRLRASGKWIAYKAALGLVRKDAQHHPRWQRDLLCVTIGLLLAWIQYAVWMARFAP